MNPITASPTSSTRSASSTSSAVADGSGGLDAAPPGPGAHADPVVAPAQPPGLGTTAAALAVRTLKKFLRTPQLVFVGTIQGAMFLLIFRYVFGGAIRTGGVRYVDFLVPGFVVTGVLFSGMGAAAGVAEDVATGFHDRLRSLPIPRVGVLAGRAAADTSLVAWGLVITTAIGFAVGFRLHNGIAAGLGGLGLCVVYGFAFAWLFILIGLLAGNAQAAQGFSLLVFPLTFVSSAYVPVDSMPGWMQPFAEHQPLTVMTDAVRSLALGPVDGHAVVVSLLWAAGLTLVFAPLALLRYRRG
jgi:ABC transporter DrrB family efflux protein